MARRRLGLSDERRLAAEVPLRAAFARALDQVQRRVVAAAGDAATTVVAAAGDPEPSSWGAAPLAAATVSVNPAAVYDPQWWAAAYRQRVRPTLRSFYRRSTVDAADFFRSDWDENDPDLAGSWDALDAATERWGDGLGEFVSGQVQKAADGGSTVGGLLDVLSGSDDGWFNPGRAALLAGVAVAAAWNQASQAAATSARRQGSASTKTWTSVGDDRVRDSHVAMDGVTVSAADEFLVGGVHPASGPHDERLPVEEVANCRCWLSWSRAGDEDSEAVSLVGGGGRSDQVVGAAGDGVADEPGGSRPGEFVERADLGVGEFVVGVGREAELAGKPGFGDERRDEFVFAGRVADDFVDPHRVTSSLREPFSRNPSIPAPVTSHNLGRFEFDPGQERDENGRWMPAGGGSSDGAAGGLTGPSLEKLLPVNDRDNPTLPAEVGDFLGQYVGAGYHGVNGSLRGAGLRIEDVYEPGDELYAPAGDAAAAAAVAKQYELVGALADQAQPLPVDAVLHRALGSEKAWPAPPKVGDEYVEDAFMSTSTRQTVSDTFASYKEGSAATLLQVEAPKGTPAIMVGNYGMESEHEVLLPPGARYQVVGVSGRRDGDPENVDQVVRVRIVGQDRSSLDAAAERAAYWRDKASGASATSRRSQWAKKPPRTESPIVEDNAPQRPASQPYQRPTGRFAGQFLYNPDQERDDNGRWTGGGGSGIAGLPKGWSKGLISGRGRRDGAGTLTDPVFVGADLDLAARLISEGKHVRLDQPAQIATLLDRLAATAKEDGGQAPDLCLVSVENTNLFCKDTMGIPRAQMPQLSGRVPDGSPAVAFRRDPSDPDSKADLREPFRDALIAEGVRVTEDRIPASRLRATQDQLDGSKVAGMLGRIRAGTFGGEETIFVTRDNYVIDGHHRWAAMVARDSEDGNLGDVQMPVRVVDMDIGAALDYANEFSARMGVPAKVMGQAAADPAAFAAALGAFGYNPDQERDENGRWTSGGGSDSSTEDSRDSHDGMERPRHDDPAIDARFARAFTPGPAIGGTERTASEQAAKVNAVLDDGDAYMAAVQQFDTQVRNTNAEGEWSAERDAMHERILADFAAANDGVPTGHEMIMTGGLGGAGKTTILKAEAERLGMVYDGNTALSHVVINPDDFKERIWKQGGVPNVPGWTPAEASTFVHEEASYLANQAAAKAVAEGKNVVWDFTMASHKSIESRFQPAVDNGYTVKAVYVDTTTDMSRRSALTRHQDGFDEYQESGGASWGGRLVPEGNYAKSQPSEGSPYRSKNREAFEQWTAENPEVKTLVIDNEDYARRVIRDTLRTARRHALVHDFERRSVEQADSTSPREFVDSPHLRVGGRVGFFPPATLVDGAGLPVHGRQVTNRLRGVAVGSADDVLDDHTARVPAPAVWVAKLGRFYSEAQPRDERGRWGSGGSANEGRGILNPGGPHDRSTLERYDTTRDELPILPGTRHKEGLMTGGTPQRGTVTEPAAKALSAYQGGDYKQINGGLRSGGAPDSDAQELTAHIDRYHEVKRDVTAYRVVDASKFPLRAGTAWTDKGFTSTDLNGAVSHDWPVNNRALLAIRVPEGTRGMAAPTEHVGVRELLLQRGTSFEVARPISQGAMKEYPPKQNTELFDTGFPGGVWEVNITGQRRKDADPAGYTAGRRGFAAGDGVTVDSAERFYDWDLTSVDTMPSTIVAGAADQPRDEKGRWSATGGGFTVEGDVGDTDRQVIESTLSDLTARYPIGTIRVRFATGEDSITPYVTTQSGPAEHGQLAIHVNKAEWEKQAPTREAEWVSYLVDSSPQGTFTHEYGHAVHRYMGNHLGEADRAELDRVTDPAAWPGLDSPSPYSTENRYEMAAELFNSHIRGGHMAVGSTGANASDPGREGYRERLDVYERLLAKAFGR